MLRLTDKRRGGRGGEYDVLGDQGVVQSKRMAATARQTKCTSFHLNAGLCSSYALTDQPKAAGADFQGASNADGLASQHETRQQSDYNIAL